MVVTRKSVNLKWGLRFYFKAMYICLPSCRFRHFSASIWSSLTHLFFLFFFSDSVEDELELSAVRHRPEGLEQLEAQTRFSRKELQILYRGFKNVSDTPTVEPVHILCTTLVFKLSSNTTLSSISKTSACIRYFYWFILSQAPLQRLAGGFHLKYPKTARCLLLYFLHFERNILKAQDF